MQVSTFAFIVAAAAGSIGMSAGIYMGIAHDFTLVPAHAHLNLLGWVTMALYGLYHRGIERPCPRLAWAQVGAGATGFPAMTGGLAYMLATGDGRAMPLVIAGSFLCLASMLLFLGIVTADALAGRSRAAPAPRPA